MRRAVYKYSIELTDGDQTVNMPMGATVVKVAPQNDKICIWAMVNVDPSVPKIPVKYRVFGTGHPFPDDAIHMETVFMGEYVWHVFKTGGYHA